MSDTYHNTLNKFRVADGVPLYHIATSYGRVSFIAQQWRALALAHCLKQRFEGHEASADIAIVGGGVSGVTTLVALRMHGFDKARLFEAQEEVLGTHTACEHRHAHPSYNFWPFSPQNERAFPATTALPFLNWHSDRVSSVIAQIKEDPFLNALVDMSDEAILPGKGLTKVALGRDKNCVGESKLMLYFYDTIERKSDTPPMKVDALIMATGFGQEKNLNSSRSGSYWWADHIKHYRSEHHRYAKVNAYISGNGDGALIDYARFRSKMRIELDRHEENVALALMGELRPSEFRVLDIDESEVHSETPEAKVRAVYEDAKTARDAAAKGSENGDRAANLAGVEVLNDLIENLAGDWIATEGHGGTPSNDNGERIVAFLGERFRDCNGDVQLVLRCEEDEQGRMIRPPAFRADATPANVVLTALLMNGDSDSYVTSGSVNEVDQKLELDEGSVTPGTDIHVARNGVGDWHDLVEFKGQLKVKIQQYNKRLGSDRSKMAEHVGAGHMHDNIINSASLNLSEYNPTNEILKSLQAAEILKSRHRLAQDFFTKVDRDATIREMRPGRQEPARFIVTLSDAQKAEIAMRGMGGIERNAFGSSVDFEVGALTGSDDPVEMDSDES